MFSTSNIERHLLKILRSQINTAKKGVDDELMMGGRGRPEQQHPVGHGDTEVRSGFLERRR